MNFHICFFEFLSFHKNSLKNVSKMLMWRQMLKEPPLNPWTYISPASNIDRGAIICSKICSKKLKWVKKLTMLFSITGQTSGLYWSNLLLNIFYAPMFQISDFGRSDRYCHHRSDNYIIILRKCMSKEKVGVLLASTHVTSSDGIF